MPVLKEQDLAVVISCDMKSSQHRINVYSKAYRIVTTINHTIVYKSSEISYSFINHYWLYNSSVTLLREIQRFVIQRW